MDCLMNTKANAVYYILDKRDEIQYKVREAMDLGNEEAAKVLRLAAESLSACVRYLVDVPVV